MLSRMLESYVMIKEQNIDIVYSGPVWADTIENIAIALKRRMEVDSLPLSVSQSVFSVFIELANNMLMYSAERETHITRENTPIDFSKGIIALGSDDEKYFVQIGNVIKADSAKLIKTRIDYLNTLSKPELREYYKKLIRSDNTNPESRGGGIGFIEIARRASSKIEYSFEKYDDDMMFFAMFVSI